MVKGQLVKGIKSLRIRENENGKLYILEAEAINYEDNPIFQLK